jgi:sugar transferase (PEP-CTERM/EpsH1 system associated)
MSGAPPRNLLFVTHSLRMGGIEMLIVRFARHWVARGWRVHAACFASGGVLENELRASGVTVHDLAKREGLDFGLPGRLRRLIRAEHIDVVHTNNFSPWLYVELARIGLKVRVVHTEHSLVEGELRRRWIAERLLAKRSDAVVAVSADVRKQMIERCGIDPAHVRVIVNGVDTEQFSPSSESRASVREQYAIPVNAPLVGTVGRLVPVKDQANLLRAFAALEPFEGVLPWLLIVGDGPEAKNLRELAVSLRIDKRVVFAGLRHDTPRLLGALDVFALSSLSEGMSVGMLEAMSVSLPVVATNVGGNPQLIREGDTGLLVPVADSPALAGGLSRLIGDAGLRAALGRNARDFCAREFSFTRMLDAYGALYEGP